MKKLLVFCLSVMLTIPSFAQDTTKLTAKYVYEDVKQGFTNLVSKLEGPAKHTYEVYVRQQRVEATGYIIACLLLLIIFPITFIKSWVKADFDDDSAWNIICIVSGIFSALGIILTIVFFVSGSYSQIVNPEYWAIQEIVKQIK